MNKKRMFFEEKTRIEIELRKKYGEKLDSISGCLFVLENIFKKSKRDLARTKYLLRVDERYNELINLLEVKGEDVLGFRRRSLLLFQKVDKKMERFLQKYITPKSLQEENNPQYDSRRRISKTRIIPEDIPNIKFLIEEGEIK